MKVTGFTIIRNAIKYDYPVVEAITSILPICDEFVVAVGESEDATLALIQSIRSDKIRIIQTVWDDTLREGGKVLADETNKAIAAIAPDTDWAFYIQSDEVVHEQYLPMIQRAMQTSLNDSKIEGLLLNYIHFYGSYRYVADSRSWYRREIRVFRHTGNVVAYKDAQGFRTKENRKLSVRLIDAYVYHYGWVKSLDKQKAKMTNFSKYWYDDARLEKVRQEVSAFDYSGIDSLEPFSGTYPAVMAERVRTGDTGFTHETTNKRLSLKKRVLLYVEQRTGWRIGEYRNYRLVEK